MRVMILSTLIFTKLVFVLEPAAAAERCIGTEAAFAERHIGLASIQECLSGGYRRRTVRPEGPDA